MKKFESRTGNKKNSRVSEKKRFGMNRIIQSIRQFFKQLTGKMLYDFDSHLGQKIRHRARRMQIETLESKQMLAVTADFDSGIFTVFGTMDGDNIQIGSNVSGYVTNNDEVMLVNGFGVLASDVESIEVYGSDGNDDIKMYFVTLTEFPNLLNVTILGEDGADTLWGTEFGDHIYGGASGSGIDQLSGLGGDDYLYGEDGIDYLVGGEGDDRLYGGDGDDRLSGAEGDDSFIGGLGNDFYRLWGDHSTLGHDYILDSLGIDTLDFSLLDVGINIDLISSFQTVASGFSLSYAYRAKNVIGTNFADTITGNSSNNLLTGSLGDDEITGLEGDDTLIGGYGDDSYFYLTNINHGNDLIKEDMNSTDKNDGLYFNTLPVGVNVNMATGKVVSSLANITLKTTTGNFSGDAIERVEGTTSNDVIYTNTEYSSSILGFGGTNTISYYTTAYFEASNSIDDLLTAAGTYSAEKTQVYSTGNNGIIGNDYTPGNNAIVGTPVRNTGSWVYSLDLTSASPFNNRSGTNGAGTLISPRHLVGTTHVHSFITFGHVGDVVSFIDNANNIITRTIEAIDFIPAEEGATDGLEIMLLDESVGPEFTPAKVLPADWEDYFPSSQNMATFGLTNIGERTIVGDTSDMHSGFSGVIDEIMDPESIRLPYYTSLIGGDSGNPIYTVIAGEAVLLATFIGGTGPSLHSYHDQINEIMRTTLLGGEAIPFQLTDVDLSSFQRFGLSEIPTGLDLSTASDNGLLYNDNSTTNTTITITGTAVTGAGSYTVQLFDGATPIGSPIAANSDGSWSITVSGLDERIYNFTARYESADGSHSGRSTPLKVIIDPTSPFSATFTEYAANIELHVQSTIVKVDVYPDEDENVTFVLDNSGTVPVLTQTTSNDSSSVAVKQVTDLTQPLHYVVQNGVTTVIPLLYNSSNRNWQITAATPSSGITNLKFQYAQQLKSLTIETDSLVEIGDVFSSGTLFVETLSIQNGGVLDLTSNNLVVDYSGTSSNSTLTGTVQSYVTNGINETANTPWIISSVAVSGVTRLATVDNYYAGLGDTGYELDGLYLGANNFTQVVVRYTYLGDGNLDGAVDITDYNNVQNYFGLNSSNTNWYSLDIFMGDVDGDGDIDISDYNYVQNNFSLNGL